MMIHIRPNRHPLAVYLYLLCSMSGASSLTRLLPPAQTPEGDPSTLPAIELLPWQLRASWYLLLLVGGLFGLAAALYRDDVMSLLVERVGLTALGPSAFIWSMVLVSTSNPYAAVLTVLFGGACAWRWWRIRSELKSVIAARGLLQNGNGKDSP